MVDDDISKQLKILERDPLEPIPGERRILVCGDRYWTDREFMRRIFVEEEVPLTSVLIQGGNGILDPKTKRVVRGADLMAYEIGRELGIIWMLQFDPDWEQYGKAAGPIRNQRMIDLGKPTELWAFHPDITRSRGTKDMWVRARLSSIPRRLFGSRREIREEEIKW